MIPQKCISVIKFNLAVGEAKSGPQLAPILGQAQIPVPQFCNDFNDKTKHLQEGVVLPTKIHKWADKSTRIEYQSPTLHYLIEQIFMHRGEINPTCRYISLYELMDLFNIVKQFNFLEGQRLDISDKQLFKEILAFLFTKKILLSRYRW